eukprot:CAMPEP_0172004592 /NCGR_PEP_ID=MMETSP1041-20130122/4567_1 /TAXON_ID=464988 /ORGANISM="Hemiselmis andersenii, Strain CCMP439" /LENGTH=474 /DNA_ID=CAMNT_0012658473 /DNA_START=74 /DNA_END=1498 /DNA_ORIENTATION=+
MEGGLFQLFDERQAEALLGGERSSSGLGLALEPEEGGFDFSVVRGDSCAFSLSRTASTAMADSPRILMECDTISGEGTPGSSSTTDTAASSAPTATGFLSSSSGANRHAPVRAPAQDDQGGASSATSSSVNPSGYFAFTGGPVGDTGVVRRGAGGLKGERGKKGSVSGSHNSSPRSEGESSRDGSVGTGVAGTGAPDARLEDKKRRNRESARMCRAKKKSSIMALQAEHDDLRASNDNLKKENESLRTVNAALEKQLAFFQNLFRDTMQGGGSKPHLLPVTAPQREGEADPDPQAATFSTAATSSGCALALSLLLATYNMQPTTGIYSRSAGDFVPHDTPFAPPLWAPRPRPPQHRRALRRDPLPPSDLRLFRGRVLGRGRGRGAAVSGRHPCSVGFFGAVSEHWVYVCKALYFSCRRPSGGAQARGSEVVAPHQPRLRVPGGGAAVLTCAKEGWGAASTVCTLGMCESVQQIE